MYEAFFGLRRRPFSAVAQADEYYPAAAVDAARLTLDRCIRRGEGAGVVIGSSGLGKTLLLHVLARQLAGELRVALLARGSLGTRRALLQAFLYEFGQPYRGLDEGELRLALVDYLSSHAECARGVLLLVDEGHLLPIRLLDEIRMLTNLVVNGQPRVRLVLAGNPALEERLASPKLESFSQRIVARCYLESFTRAETEEYLATQLRKAGGNPDALLHADTAAAVQRITDGTPRLINQVCDHALLLAYAGGRRQVTAACVEEAWSDLQQLPNPCAAAETTEAAGGKLIEFGTLDGDAPLPAAAADTSQSQPMFRLAGADEDDEPAVEPLLQLEQIQDALHELEDDFQPLGSIGPEIELVFADPGNPFSERFAEEEMVVERQAEPAGEIAAAGPLPVAAPAALEIRVAAANDSDPATLPMPQAPAAATPEVPAERIQIEEGYDEVQTPVVRHVTPIRHQEYRRLFARLRQA